MRLVSTEIYKYSELSEGAKEKARNDYIAAGVEVFYADAVIETVKEAGAALGFSIKEVYYSGFYSLGDGMSLEAEYAYVADKSSRLIDAFGKADDVLNSILFDLEALPTEARTATATISGSYAEPYLLDFVCGADDASQARAADTILKCAKRLAEWGYAILEEEYEYQTSEEGLADHFEANEFEFSADGSFYVER